MKKKMALSVVENLDHGYIALLAGVRRSFDAAVTTGATLFQTDASDLFGTWHSTLPAEEQQHYNCHTCRDFINRYGSIVTVTDEGHLKPTMWDLTGETLGFHADAAMAAYKRVCKARIVSPFVSKDREWGKLTTGDWHHLSVTVPVARLYVERLLTAGQKMAEWREDFKTVKMALADVDANALVEAVNLFATDALAWGDKFVAPAKWLLAQKSLGKKRTDENLLWKAVAEAPAGFKHPRASVLWPLLEGIEAGDSYDVLRRKFGAMTAPLQYQRPQAAPTEGNVKAGEAVIAKLGLQKSLERRFARLEDLTELTWSPKNVYVEQKADAGVFSHLKTKRVAVEVRQVQTPATTMTWDKFLRTILPNATDLQLRAPSHGRYIALTTAEHADAPPIFKWDREDERNPVAWYVHPNGSPASRWDLRVILDPWVAITAVVPLPSMKHAPHIGQGYILVLQGCVDRTDAGNALFPVCLKDEVFGIRATIEAYSRSARLGGREEADACGYDIRKEAADCHLRATVDGRWQEIKIDRWD